MSEPDRTKWVGVRTVPGAEPIPVEDTGENTNPRVYEVENGFRSPVIARAGGVATALWTTGTNPARTAGKTTVIYHIQFENSTGATVTVWLESPTGTVITVPIPVANNQSYTEDFSAGLRVGDQDVFVNASANGARAMISGLEV